MRYVSVGQGYVLASHRVGNSQMEQVSEILKSRIDSSLYEYGFADLRGLLSGKYAGYAFGISIIRHLDGNVIDSLTFGPTRDYFDHYTAINRELNSLVDELSADLNSAGIQCAGVRATVEDSEVDGVNRSRLAYAVSHKMVATRAGLGWIGKTDLLVSKRFGPRIRLASIVTQQPLDVATPINESQCGTCMTCVRACPAQAANGKSWNIQVARDEFFDPLKCREYCRKITKEKLNKNESLCGKCISVCPIGK